MSGRPARIPGHGVAMIRKPPPVFIAEPVVSTSRMSVPAAAAAPQGTLREAVLASERTRVVEALGIRRTREWVETQLSWLEQIGAIELRSSDLPGLGPVMVATLLGSGRDHVERRAPLAGVSWPAGRG